MDRSLARTFLLVFLVAPLAVGSPRPAHDAPTVPTVARVEAAPGLTVVVYPASAVVWIAGTDLTSSAETTEASPP